MRQKKRRWIAIQVPTSRGIEEFKKRIKPFVDLVAISMVGRWAANDYKKVAVRRMIDKPVASSRLKEAHSMAKKELERYYYKMFGKLAVPEHFRKNKEYRFEKEYGPPVRIFFDRRVRTRYVDIGNTRLTTSNWQEFVEEIVPAVNNYLDTASLK